jgi:hypothetical protein
MVWQLEQTPVTFAGLGTGRNREKIIKKISRVNWINANLGVRKAFIYTFPPLRNYYIFTY